MPAFEEPPRLGPLRGPGSLTEHTRVRGDRPEALVLPDDARTVWARADPPETEKRAWKHRLVHQTKLIVEAVALLDLELTDAAELEDLVAEAIALADNVAARPSLQALGGLALVGGDDSALLERSPFSGRSNPLAPPLHLQAEDDLTRGWAVWTEPYEGPPNTLHGGFVAAAFDDLMGFAQAASGTAGYTGTLMVRMHRPTPLLQRIDYEAGVDRVEGRKIFVWGTAKLGDVLLAESQILFIEPRHGAVG
jgi:acyl-coenzyme A thioesterase PaaI-like protein